jgi:hypothetical protein
MQLGAWRCKHRWLSRLLHHVAQGLLPRSGSDMKADHLRSPSSQGREGRSALRSSGCRRQGPWPSRRGEELLQPQIRESEVDDILKVTPNTGPLLYFSHVSYPLLSLISSYSPLSSLQPVWRRTSMAMVCRRPSAQRHRIWGPCMTTGAP